jgi:DNA repair protein RecO (recombination protein O)
VRERVEFEPAYLLSQRPYRETSQLLEAFSAGHGRIGLVARGARGPRSKLRGLLQAFTPLLLSWTESGELGTLTGAEAAGSPPALPGERVFHGWYLNELLLKLLQRHDAHPRLYRDYVMALDALAGADAEAALRVFEKRLLTELGYALPLDQELEPELSYRFDLERGASPAVGAGDQVYAGASLIALREERLDTRESLRDARKLLRVALERQLGGRALEAPRQLRALRAAMNVPVREPGIQARTPPTPEKS